MTNEEQPIGKSVKGGKHVDNKKGIVVLKIKQELK